MSIKKTSLLIICIVVIFLCFLLLRSVMLENKKKFSGVALTFDDHSVENWYKARPLFKKYGAKVTFFIDKIHKFDRNELNMLKILKEDEHEIACHGFNHLNATDFIQNNSLNEYLNSEIYPAIGLMVYRGFSPKSFAYPFGARSKKVDEILLKEFSIIRGTAYTNSEKRIKDLDVVFYKQNQGGGLIHAVGIDSIYGNTIDEILDGIKRAKNNEEVLILYGHLIEQHKGKKEGYITSKKTLEEIMKYVCENKLKFYTVSELVDFNNW